MQNIHKTFDKLFKFYNKIQDEVQKKYLVQMDIFHLNLLI